MGVYTDGARERIDETIELWKERCLLGDGSLLWPEDHLWTADHVRDLRDRFRAQPMYGQPGSFEDKLNRQLDEAPADVRRLASETLVIYNLFVGWILLSDTKREMAASVLPDGVALPETEPVHSGLGEGIGSPGPGWLFNRGAEFGLLVDVLAGSKTLERDRQEELLAEPWDFEAWIDDFPGATTKQMRHILLHLLFPKTFERIASGGHKRTITEVFRGLVDNPPDDEDRHLGEIRDRLRQLLASGYPHLADDDQFDFYREPVSSAWLTGDAENLAALRFKKQIVLYGPPGTSKTYQAKELAAGLIRQHALENWGAARVFSDPAAVEAVVENNTHRLQLHPAYSYEDFVRGLAIGADGATEYRPGYLMRLRDDIEEQRTEQGDDALPHVLILDKLNRADLSRVLGEAFSLLEDRDQVVELPGGNPGEKPTELALPMDLYVIGTMNLIDQSVEQIDFALRRRFMWRECRFQGDVLLTVVRQRWEQSGQRTPWSRIESDMRRLVEAAENLNARIAEMGALGERYEVGHAYFFDIVPLLERQMPPKRASTAKQFLWHGGQPQGALVGLWELALSPLLGEYLAGLDAAEAEQALGELRAAFVMRPA